MDEQWGLRRGFIAPALAVTRMTGSGKTVVAHVFGRRTMATLGRLMSLLAAADVVLWMTDGWPLYESA